MKKGLLFALIPVTAAALFSGTWFLLAANAVSSAERMIAEFNAPLPNNTQAPLHFSYERIEKKGFPFAIALHFVNPTLQLNTAPLPPTEIPPTALSLPASGQGMHIVWKHQGDLMLSTHYLSQRYALALEGSGTATLSQNNLNIPIQYAGYTAKAVAKIDSFAHFFALQRRGPKAIAQWMDEQAMQAENPLAFIESLMIDTSAVEATTTYGSADATPQPFASFAATHLRWHNTPLSKRIAGGFSFESEGITFHPAYDTIAKALNPLSVGMGTAQGKTAIHLDFDYDFRAPRALPDGLPQQQESLDGMIRTTHCLYRNDIMTFECPTHIDWRHKTADIKIDWNLNMTPKIGSIASDAGYRMLAMFAPMLGAPIAPPSEAKQALHTLLPNLSTLGPIRLALDMSLTPPTDTAVSTRTTTPLTASLPSIVLQRFLFGHKRWSIESTGSLTQDPAIGTKYDLRVDCRRCQYLIYDTFTATYQTKQLLTILQTGMQENFPILSRKLYDDMTKFAETVGRKDFRTGDIAFGITSNGTQIAINQQPLDLIMAHAMAIFMGEALPTATPTPAIPPVGR